jgi:hypothetical protein
MIRISLNFFVEGHGKGPLDQHFSGVAYTIKLASLDKQLTCSKDIINAINERQSSINNHRSQKSKYIFHIILRGIPRENRTNRL